MDNILTNAQQFILDVAAHKDKKECVFQAYWSEYNENYGDYNDYHGDYYDAE